MYDHSFFKSSKAGSFGVPLGGQLDARPASPVNRPCPLHIVMTANAAWNVWHFRRPVVESLLAEGHRVTVLAPLDEATTSIEGLGCRFIPLAMDTKGLNPFRDLALAARMHRVFAAEKPDIVLGYTIKNNIFGGLAAKSAGVPFMPNVTGLGTAFLSGRNVQLLVETLYRIAFRALPVVFFQNQDDRDLFLNRRLVTAGQARLLPGSGVDLRHFAPAEFPVADPPVFLMIARLLRDKGVVEFVEAARAVRERYPRARFQLLGAAGVANRTAIDLGTVRGWERTHGIEYLGTSPDVRPQIAAAHCVVLPSYREGAPRTLIEAAAMARPVIATDVPGCRSVVEAGSTGLLCQPRDPRSLAAACLDFLALTHPRRKAMGEAGRIKMERDFCQSIVVRSYREALSVVTGRR